jgi:hypothetical protein
MFPVFVVPNGRAWLATVAAVIIFQTDQETCVSWPVPHNPMAGSVR